MKADISADISIQALLWDFVDPYYRNNWFLKAFGDLSFHLHGLFRLYPIIKGPKGIAKFQTRQLKKGMSPY